MTDRADTLAGARDAKPVDARAFSPLALPAPPGDFREQAAMALFNGRVLIGSEDQIVSAPLDAANWQTVYTAPQQALTPAAAELAEAMEMINDAHVAQFRNAMLTGAFGTGPFVVFQGKSDASPAVYCPMRSIFGGALLRTDDGKNVQAVGQPGLGDPSLAALGPLVACGDWLIAAEAPIMHKDRKRGPVRSGPVRILASRDPAAGDWAHAAEPGFGAQVSGGVTALATAFGRVFAAVQDVDRGFELWQATPGRNLPWTWERVLQRGAHGYSLAPTVTRLAAFNGALFVASGVSASGFGKDYAGPGAAEIVRVNADGGWDLIVGRPRFTPDGFKVPLSGYGPGFDNGFHTLILSLTEHDGVLYAGTRNVLSEFRIYRAKEGETPEVSGGAEIWASQDGETWQPMMRDGNDNPAVTGIREICSDGGQMAVAMSINANVMAIDLGMPAQQTSSDALEVWIAG